MALPINSMRFINGETEGMKRLSIKPEKKAPKIPSKPISSQVAALINMRERTKIYCITESEYLRRNQRVTCRIIHVVTAHHVRNFTVKNIQNIVPVPPVMLPTNAATTTRAKKSDNMEAPTERVETLLRCNPYLMMMG